MDRRIRSGVGRLDTLVFADGTEKMRPSQIRARICDGLGLLGIEFEERRNVASAAAISATVSRVAVRVIRTDEELMIARLVCRALGLGMANEGMTGDPP